MSQSASLQEFLRTGKMDADFEVFKGYVTGICILYAERTAQEYEYIIREKSIVLLANRELSECVQEAKDLSCRSALNRLLGVSLLPAAEPGKTVLAQQKPAPGVAPAFQKPDMTEHRQEKTEQGKSASGEESMEQDEEEGLISSGVAQVGFDDLRPVSSLMKSGEETNGPAPEEEDAATEKARAMPITILGKLHECNGWTAGKILDERPDVIVEFANRYNGPKTEERDALRTLYTEALRRANRAA